MAYIEVTSTSETKITVRMNGLDTSWNQGTRTVYWYIDGTRDGTSTLPNKVSYGGAYTFSGLSSGTEYHIQAEVKATGLDVWFSTYAQTDEPVIYIEPWSWGASNGSATASETSRALSALSGNGKTTDFSYKVWNDICDKVYEVIQATGTYWATNYTTYSAARMSSADKRITAARFNSVRYNIGSRYSTGISEVYPGDIIYGWYFTTLTSCLNKWINSI